MSNLKKLERKQKRLAQQIKVESPIKIKAIKPLTINQNRTFKSFYEDQHLFLHGVAGTGKTLISLYLALDLILSGLSVQNKVVIVRSIVPTRDIGFLPGNSKEKSAEYELPYKTICDELFETKGVYDRLKSKGTIEFINTSFIRGLTLTDSVVIVDEVQNLTAHEAHSIITRIGKNCRIIFTGDIKQTDLNKRKELSGLADFIRIIQKMKSFSFVEFGVHDILRSSLVKEYIMARDALENAGAVQPLGIGA